MSLDVTKKQVKEILSHFPDINSKVKSWIRHDVMNNYIIVKDMKHKDKGWCSCCRHVVELENSRHLANVVCPYCGAKEQVIFAWRRKAERTEVQYWVYFNKSKKDKDAVVARWGESVRNEYNSKLSSYDNILNYVLGYYVFYPHQVHKKNIMLKHNGRANWPFNKCKSFYPNEYELRKTIFPLNNSSDYYFNCRQGTFIDAKSLLDAVKNTKFQYIFPDKLMPIQDMAPNHEQAFIRWLDVYNKYPALEYLWKIGLKRFTRDIVDHIYMIADFGVNAKGKTIKDFLGFNPTPEEVAIIEEQGSERINIIKYWEENLKNLGIISLAQFAGARGMICCQYELERLKRIHLYEKSFVKIFNHLEKWRALYLNKQTYNDILTTWDDYIDILKQHHLNVKDLMYPKDLFKEHSHQVMQIKLLLNKEVNKKIINRAKDLGKLSYQNESFVIRPINDYQELYEEGNFLHHCVASYADRYASGKTNIFTIRDIKQPAMPIVTVEINKKSIVQARAKFDHRPKKDVATFLKEYQKAKGLKGEWTHEEMY